MSDPIFINGRFLAQPTSGVQRYAREIVRALDRGAGAGDYILLTPQGADSLDLDVVQVRTLSGPRGHLWEQTALAWAARHGRLLSLGGSGPVLHRRQTVVIHDAAVFRHPQHFRPTYASLHRLLGRTLARRARLATVSQFSRAELAQALATPAEAITLAPNGADHFAKAAPAHEVLHRLDVRGRPFFIALGNLAPNKNIAVMIRALRRLPDANVRLVLVGGRDLKVFRAALGDDPRVILAGRLTDAEVAALLGKARALVFASFYEGFGIPPLEAFARDCQVLASDIPAVREVCGEAPRYFNANDDAALARLMRDAIDQPVDPERRALGQERVAAYRWEASAAVLDALVKTSW